MKQNLCKALTFGAIALLTWGTCWAQETSIPPVETADQQAATSRPATEMLLPATTKAWLSISDARRMIDQFKLTGLGQLSEKPEMKPFVDMVTQKIRGTMDEKNFRLGITLDDIRDVRSGEICFAGVLMGDGIAASEHGIVLLADVNGKLEKAQELLDKVAKQMVDLGCERQPVEEIQGAQVTPWKVPHAKDPNYKFDTYQTISDGWLIATDNRKVLFDVLLRIRQIDQNQAIKRLADDETFTAIMSRAEIQNTESEIRWFVEPFGYIELAQEIAKKEQILKKRDNDHAQKLRENGFDALRGIGGVVTVNKHDFDALHRTFVFTAADQVNATKRKNALEIFDLRNVQKSPLAPPAFVPTTYNSYFGFTWNMGKAYDHIGPVVDIFGGKDFFQQLEQSLKNDSKVDLREMVSKFGNQIEVVSTTRKPIGTESERVAFLIPVQGTVDEQNKMLRDIKRLSQNSEMKKENGLEYIEITNEDESDSEIQIDIINKFDEEEVVDAEEEEGHTPFLFEKKYVAIFNQHLVLANHADVLFELRDHTSGSNLGEIAEYGYLQEKLSNFVDVEQVSARQFGRLDRQLEANYEMFRQGKMGASKSVLARILNEAFLAEGDDPKKERSQKIQADTLPSDFENIVAPLLGLSGLCLETHPDGWLITGGILKKKLVDEVVQKQTVVERR